MPAQQPTRKPIPLHTTTRIPRSKTQLGETLHRSWSLCDKVILNADSTSHLLHLDGGFDIFFALASSRPLAAREDRATQVECTQCKRLHKSLQSHLRCLAVVLRHPTAVLNRRIAMAHTVSDTRTLILLDATPLKTIAQPLPSLL